MAKSILQFPTGDVNNTKWYFNRDTVRDVVVSDPFITTPEGNKRAFVIALRQYGGSGDGELSAMYFDEALRDQQLVKLLYALGIDNKLAVASASSLIQEA